MSAVIGPVPPTSRNALMPSWTIPAAAGRQPTCSVAIAPSAARTTGVQSAAKTSAGWFRSAVAWPSSSVRGLSGPGGSVARRTVAPWTCLP
jgi:hypothetical protein